MDGEKRLRVYNKCKHDIGVTLISGQQLNIRSGSFMMLTVNDILYIESICVRRKFFSTNMLVAVSDDGKELSLEDLGGYTDKSVQTHLNDDEIITMLKKPLKNVEAWVNGIDDPEELHAIYAVYKAKKVDLPASKLKILKTKMPEKDWLQEDDE